MGSSSEESSQGRESILGLNTIIGRGQSELLVAVRQIRLGMAKQNMAHYF